MSALVHDGAPAVRVRVTPDEDVRARRFDPILDHCGFQNSAAKYIHAKARIARILEGAGSFGASTFAEAVKTAAIPHLAVEVMNLYINFQLPDRQSKRNPFVGLSQRDRQRVFLAMVYDICDRSTGKLGPWWVK